MNTLMKYAGGATLAAGLLLTATTGQAHDWNAGAAAAGFVAGAAVTSGPYYDAGYYDSYAYDPGPGYYGYGYAYAPRGYANYWARSRSLNHGEGPGCIQSPGSHEYTSCD